jgi:hypothetical protein
VHDRWKDEPEAAGFLDYIYEVIQRRNNLLLHGSPTAYRQVLTQHSDGRIQLNRVGPDALWMESLAQGAGGYYLVLRVMAEEFGLGKERLAEAFSRATSYCRKLDEFPGLGDIPDEAECPCGSGQAVGQCHRSWLPPGAGMGTSSTATAGTGARTRRRQRPSPACVAIARPVSVGRRLRAA